MPTRDIEVTLRAPAGVSETAKEAATAQAHEAAVLALWTAGELSTRQAAEELGLDYHQYLDLLAEKGIPVESGPLDLAALEDARRRLSGDAP
jgi:hypothetical protein